MAGDADKTGDADLIKVGNLVTVKIGPDGLKYYSGIVEVGDDGKTVRIAPSVRGWDRIEHRGRWGWILDCDLHDDTVKFHPRPYARWREIKDMLIDAALKESESPMEPYRLYGMCERFQSRDGQAGTIDGADDGLVLYARSILGATIAYRNWLDARVAVRFTQFKWDQLDVCKWDGCTPENIWDYIPENIEESQLAQFIRKNTSPPSASFPDTHIKHSAKK